MRDWLRATLSVKYQYITIRAPVGATADVETIYPMQILDLESAGIFIGTFEDYKGHN